MIPTHLQISNTLPNLEEIKNLDNNKLEDVDYKLKKYLINSETLEKKTISKFDYNKHDLDFQKDMNGEPLINSYPYTEDQKKKNYSVPKKNILEVI